MKREFLWVLLGVEAIACVLLSIARASFTGLFSSAMAFPFEQLGLGLRWLSLWGVLGNAVAVALYALLCLAPAALMLVRRKKRGLYAEDALLGLLSALLFAVLYLMINPAVIGAFTSGAEGIPVGKVVLGCAVYSLVCGYAVLRVLRLFSLSGADELTRYLALMLALMAALLVYVVCGACFGALLDALAALRAGNSGNEHLLGVSYVFLALQFIVDALPYALDVAVIFAALRLLHEFRADRYAAATVAATERMSRLCVVALTATVLANIGFNLLQLLLAKWLLTINSSVQIPLFSIAFVLAALLLTRFVAENKQLKDDNDMFI